MVVIVSTSVLPKNKKSNLLVVKKRNWAGGYGRAGEEGCNKTCFFSLSLSLLSLILMEVIGNRHQAQLNPQHYYCYMNSIASKFRPIIRLHSPNFKSFSNLPNTHNPISSLNFQKTLLSTSPSNLAGTHEAIDGLKYQKSVLKGSAQLKNDWLDSLTCSSNNTKGSDWVIGIDPDVSGALALLKPHHSGCSAQVLVFLFFCFFSF